MDIKKIGERIKYRRESLGLTQEEVGMQIGLNKSTIARYEMGKIDSIKLPTIQAIANVLKVNPAWLSGKDVEMKIKESGSIDSEFFANDPNEKELLVLFREAGQNQAEKERLVKLFESTVDVFMEAKGIDPNKPDED